MTLERSPDTVNVGSDTDTVVTGSLTATDAVVAAHAGDGSFRTGVSTAASYLALLCPGGDSAWNIQLTGTFGSGTVWFEESLDSTTGLDGNWIAVNGRQTGVVNTVLASGVTAAGHYRGNTSGAKYLRVRITGATTPSVAVIMRISSGVGAVFLNASTPAGTNAIGTVNVKTFKSAAISVAASGDNTVVSAVSGKRIKVHSIVLNAVGTVSAKWKDGASTDLTGAMDFQAREGYAVSTTPVAFLLATTAGNALVLNLSAAIGVRGVVSYWDDDAN